MLADQVDELSIDISFKAFDRCGFTCSEIWDFIFCGERRMIIWSKNRIESAAHDMLFQMGPYGRLSMRRVFTVFDGVGSYIFNSSCNLGSHA
jgi:hypothetical protein